MKPQSPIHRPLEDDADPPATPTPTRIERIAQLDQRRVGGSSRSLGPGGASAAFANAVQKALVDEIADQLRRSSGTWGDVAERELARRGHQPSEIGKWAADIIAAFEE